MNTVERARGRWREILPQVGVGVQYLTKRHGPCPRCGGKDRWNWKDRQGSGDWWCNQCGHGDGLALVKLLRGWGHKEACDAIDAIIGKDAPAKVWVSVPMSDDQRRADALSRLLGEAQDANVVSAYMEGRGLPGPYPTVLLGHPGALYRDEERGRTLGRWPAVLAPVVSLDGVVRSVQRIWRKEDVPAGLARKKTMPPVGTINGAAVQLFPVDEEIGIAEGVETAIAAYHLFGIPTWAALSAHGLEVVELPPTVRSVHIFGDNDENFEGQAAAAVLARRLSRAGRNGKASIVDVKINIPPEPGTDWLDVWNGRN